MISALSGVNRRTSADWLNAPIRTGGWYQALLVSGRRGYERIRQEDPVPGKSSQALSISSEGLDTQGNRGPKGPRDLPDSRILSVIGVIGTSPCIPDNQARPHRTGDAPDTP